MWSEIKSESDLHDFMDFVNHFHDSCLKELMFISGAYGNEDLSMYPINNQRILRVIFQQQSKESPMFELEFSGLKFLRLMPVDEQYTCELLDATLLMDDGFFYWADDGGRTVKEMNDYEGTVICASILRWRMIDNHMGNEIFYRSPV